MKIRYFADTDTVFIELADRPAVETREVNENAYIDLDADGNLIAVTLEHARQSVDIQDFSFQQFIAERPLVS